MMELISYQNAGNTNNWGQWEISIDTSGSSHIAFQGGDSRGNYITSDMVYLTLTFRCLGQGSSQMHLGDGYLDIVGQEQNVLPPDFLLTCNQFSREPSDPYHYVGGYLAPINKLALLTPYLTLAGLVAAISTVYVIKKRK